MKSLRHVLTLQLHELDIIVAKYKQYRVELICLLERHRNHYEQLQSMLRVKRHQSNSDVYVARAQQKLGLSKEQMNMILTGMSSLASDAHSLWTDALQFISLLNYDPGIGCNPLRNDDTAFKHEYKELQKAADVIHTHAKDLTGEVQIKKLQYTNCSNSDLHRLVVAWKAANPTHDRGMEELAVLMDL